MRERRARSHLSLIFALAIGLLVILFVPSLTHAQITGNDLYPMLATKSPVERNNGFYYLQGILDAEGHYLQLEFWGFVTDPRPEKEKKLHFNHFCLRDGVTLGQVAAVVTKHLESHPERRDKEAIWLVHESLTEYFPCAGNR